MPYDVRLGTFLEEFYHKPIINLQEKLTKAENERDSLKLASQKLDQNIPTKSITNERIKQKNYQSSGNANSELSTRRIDDLNKVNNSTLHILSPKMRFQNSYIVIQQIV